MAELLNALEKAGKIDSDMVKTVSNFIEQNQLHSVVANDLSTVSIAVCSYVIIYGIANIAVTLCLIVVSVLSHCCLLYTSPSPRDGLLSRMPSSA